MQAEGSHIELSSPLGTDTYKSLSLLELILLTMFCTFLHLLFGAAHLLP